MMEEFFFDPPSENTLRDLNADSFVSTTAEFESSWVESTADNTINQISDHLPSTFKIKWSNIVSRFEREFAQTFSKSKKAHFDCLPKELKVVDGARARWFPLLLLDAMIFILHNNYFRFATRRAFNQLEVLYDCILEEVKASYPSFFEKLQGLHFQDDLSWPVEQSATIYEDTSEEEEQAILSREEDGNLLISFSCAAKFPYLEIEDIAFPWGSIEELKGRMVEDPPSKSKQKFLSIIDYLSRHHSFTHHEFSFPDLLRAVVCKVLAYFGSNRSVLLPTVPSTDSPKWETNEDSCSPPLNHSPPGLQGKLLFSSLVKTSSIDLEDLKLPPVATVIARPCIRRKRSPRAKRNIKIKKGSYGAINRGEIAYSTYPNESSMLTTSALVDDFVESSEVSSSFVNPFLYEEQDFGERILMGSFVANPLVTQKDFGRKSAQTDSLSSSNDLSSNSWDAQGIFPVEMDYLPNSCFEEEKSSLHDRDDRPSLAKEPFNTGFSSFSNGLNFSTVSIGNSNTRFSLKMNSRNGSSFPSNVYSRRTDENGLILPERGYPSPYPVTAFSTISKADNLGDFYLERICASVDGKFSDERKLEVDAYPSLNYYEQPLLTRHSHPVPAHYRRERDFQFYYDDDLISSVDRKEIQ